MMLTWNLVSVGACLYLIGAVSTSASADGEKPLPTKAVSFAKLTATDGKAEVQILTVQFDMTADEKKLMGQAMNSDPYWHHLRERRITLRAGDDNVESGPRILVSDVVSPVAIPAASSKYLVTFVIPARVNLAGTTLALGDGPQMLPVKTPFRPFAELSLTEKDLTAATQPLRLSIRSVDAVDDPTAKKYRATHVVCLQTSAYVELDGVRFGKLESVAQAPRLTVNGMRRHLEPADSMFLVGGVPDATAKLHIQFKDLKAWFPCEPWAVTDRPAPPQKLK